METIENIINTKAPTVNLSDSVDSAVKTLQEHEVEGCPVTKRNKVAGMVTSRELSYHHPNRLIQDAMKKELTVVTPEMSPLEVLLLLRQKNANLLPVVDSNHRLLGIISREDILYTLNKKDFSLVRQLVEEIEDKILNPLQVIHFITKRLRNTKTQNSIQEYTEKMLNSIKRIEKTVEQLRKRI